MPRLLIHSDVHTEFHRDKGASFFSSLPDDADILVLAGDICVERDMLDVYRRAADRFEDVVFVLGNHEAYRSSIHKALDTARNCAASIANLHLLEASETIVQGVRFMGGTMWFREKLPETLVNARYMNDFHLIREMLGSADGTRPSVYDYNRACTDFLSERMAKQAVVVTHHLPCARSTPDQFVGSPLNVFFQCDMVDPILEKQPQLWIHGHTHTSCDYRLGQTRVVCNPFGYAPDAINEAHKNLAVDVRTEKDA